MAPFAILTVCTGNICRSPAAERLLAHTLASGDVRVRSAGVGAVVGSSIAPGVVAHLDADGVPSGDFRARQITEEIIDGADLVLALTRAHRARVTELSPRAVRRTFTLREMARIAAHLGGSQILGESIAERLAYLTREAPLLRSHVVVPPPDDDVVDPWLGDASTYQHSYTEVRRAVDAIAVAVR